MLFSRNTYLVVLLFVAVIAVIQGAAVIRNTTWPIERWFSAW